MSNTTAYNEQASKLTAEVHGQDAMVEIAGNPIMHPQELEAGLVPGIYFEGVKGEEGDVDEGNVESSGVSGAEGDVSSGVEGGAAAGGIRKKKSGKVGSSGEESGNTAVSSLSPSSSPANRENLSTGSPSAPNHNLTAHNFSRPRTRGPGPGNSSPDVSTDSEDVGNGNRGSGSEASTDHLVSPMTDRGSGGGRGRPGTWGSNVEGRQGFRVSSPVSEES